jgi:predicted DNA-binding transcriptional regulator AlpA
MPRTKPKSENQLKLQRLTEVAAQLSVHPSTVTRWLKNKKFPPPVFLQEGSPARWRSSDIDAFIEKRRASRKPKPKLRGALREFEG